MKTAEEWDDDDEIKMLILKLDFQGIYKKIQEDAWRQGMLDAAFFLKETGYGIRTGHVNIDAYMYDTYTKIIQAAEKTNENIHTRKT